MQYKTFQNLKLSALGMGGMRYPMDGSRIDEAALARMIAYAMENGVNYYDTAWGYHDGQSETVLGKLLRAYPRDSFYLATKFPGFSQENMANVRGIFEAQLKNAVLHTLTSTCSTASPRAISTAIWIPNTASCPTFWSKRRPDASGTWASPPMAAWRRCSAFWMLTASTWSFARFS